MVKNIYIEFKINLVRRLKLTFKLDRFFYLLNTNPNHIIIFNIWIKVKSNIDWFSMLAKLFHGFVFESLLQYWFCYDEIECWWCCCSPSLSPATVFRCKSFPVTEQMTSIIWIALNFEIGNYKLIMTRNSCFPCILPHIATCVWHWIYWLIASIKKVLINLSWYQLWNWKLKESSINFCHFPCASLDALHFSQSFSFAYIHFPSICNEVCALCLVYDHKTN